MKPWIKVHYWVNPHTHLELITVDCHWTENENCKLCQKVTSTVVTVTLILS